MTQYGSRRPDPRPQGRDGVAPAGWPREVPPPGVPSWERRAVGWLFDLCPPDFRGYELLRRQPVVLARLAGDQVTAALAACRHGLSTTRAELRGLVGPDVIEETIALYEREAARLTAVEHSLRLVEAALQGRRFVPRL